MEKRLLNSFIFLGCFFILVSGIFLMLYYFENTTNQCLADPFVYGSKAIEEATKKEFFGVGYLRLDNGGFLQLHFNSTGNVWKS